MYITFLGSTIREYKELSKPKSGARIFFFPARLFSKTRAPTMDKVRGYINGFSFGTSL